jgi:hypothetical protein
VSALLRPGGAALASPPEGPVLAPSPEGPVLAPLPEGPVLAPGGRRLSRRRMLQAGLIGGAGVAALPLLTLVGGITRTDKQAVGLAFSMNTNWLFGRYTSGSETSSYDDSNFAPVTVPHTVVPLSWKDWNYLAWQQVWIYRRHFSGAGLLDPHRPGNRILVDFDGVMVNATVSVNDHVVATHQGGYLPFSGELTGKVTGAGNLLSVVVDSRCLSVPPVGVGRPVRRHEQAAVQRVVDYGFDASATKAGLYLLPSSFALLFAGPIAGLIGRRTGFKWPLAAGMLLVSISAAGLAEWHDKPWQILAAMLILGVGVGFAFAAMATLITEAVRPTETGVATGMNTVARTVGGVVGGQVGAALLTAHMIRGTNVPSVDGYTTAFTLAAIVALVGAAVAVFITPPLRRRERLTVATSEAAD